MTEDEERRAADELFATIGRYVFIFQWIESQIEQCLMMWWDQDMAASRTRLAPMTFKKKVDALLKAFNECPANARGRSREGATASFKHLVAQLHLERRRRNSLL